eukprot:m.194283 g.194283  ORF g.194283 m.194283 type:complete len:772 (+) comp32519_c0_seq1:322-2637(+)
MLSRITSLLFDPVEEEEEGHEQESIPLADKSLEEGHAYTDQSDHERTLPNRVLTQQRPRTGQVYLQNGDAQNQSSSSDPRFNKRTSASSQSQSQSRSLAHLPPGRGDRRGSSYLTQHKVQRPFSGVPDAWRSGSDLDGSIHESIMSNTDLKQSSLTEDKLKQMEYMQNRLKQTLSDEELQQLESELESGSSDRPELEIDSHSRSEMPAYPQIPEYRFIRHKTSKQAAEDFLADSPDGTYLVRQRRPEATLALDLEDLIISVHHREDPAEEVSEEDDQIVADVTVKFSKFWHIPVSVYTGAEKKQIFTLSQKLDDDVTGGLRCFPSLVELLAYYENHPYRDEQMLGQLYGSAQGFKDLSKAAEENKSEVNQAKDAEVAKKSKPWYCSSEFYAISLIVFYFALGISYYSSLDGWTALDAAYFCVVVATTIGYGDNESISIQETQIFSAFYVLFGVAVVFSSVMILVEAVERKAKERSKEATKLAITSKFNPSNSPKKDVSKPGLGSQIISYWKSNSLLRAVVVWVIVVLIGMIFVTSYAVKTVAGDSSSYCIAESNTTASDLANGTYVSVVADSNETVVVVAKLIQTVEPDFERELKWEEAFYWAVITGTTVGFGDISLQSDGAKGFALLYLWVIVAATGIMLPEVSNLIKGGEGDLSKMLSRELDESLIREFDISGDGEVDKGEWLRAFLVALGYVDGDLCDIILSQFDQLDVSGDGNLSIEDILMATRAGKETPENRQEKADNAQRAQEWMNNSGEGGHGHGVKVGVFRKR